MVPLREVLGHLGRIAPLHLAAEWDNVGLLLGDAEGSIERVLTCLTLTPESAAEAVAEKADLVVAHHPVFFRPVQRLTTNTTEGRMLLDLARSGVAVYSAHTAYDDAPGGINDQLAAGLGLVEVRPLRPRPGPGQCKIVVFVPEADLGRVSDALFAAGAGIIGEYRECSYRLDGTGTFFGSEASNPTLGKKGRREEVREWRLEVLCPEERAEAAVRAMRAAHSYEEPAFDVYPLRSAGNGGGSGRVGKLPKPCRVDEFARRVKELLGAGAVQIVGGAEREIGTVAVACGAAGSFLNDAVRSGADAFLTGEARFHEALEARARNTALVLAGHHATERPAMEALARNLQEAFPDLRVWASRTERDPLEAWF